MRVLLTGASGFVGAAAWLALQQRGAVVRPVFRTQASALRSGGEAEL